MILNFENFVRENKFYAVFSKTKNKNVSSSFCLIEIECKWICFFLWNISFCLFEICFSSFIFIHQCSILYYQKIRKIRKFWWTFEFRFKFDIFYKRYHWFFYLICFSTFLTLFLLFYIHQNCSYFFWYFVIVFVKFCFTSTKLNNIASKIFFIQYINCFMFSIFNKLINIFFSFNSIFFNIKCQSEICGNCFSFIIFSCLFWFFFFGRVRPIEIIW